MKDFLVAIATEVWRALNSAGGPQRGAPLGHDSPGGDAQFDVDLVAEAAVWEAVKNSGLPVAIYTEDNALRSTAANPKHLLIVDPIDGTRPAAAGLESCMISLAAAPAGQDRTMADVTDALLFELATGRWIYTDTKTIQSSGYPQRIPSLSATTSLSAMFWSIEFNGHPMDLMTSAYGDLVDDSANTGAVFIFNSACYSISRIVTGQLDAYVDIGNRIMRDHPETRPRFERSGRGNILHLFPYDIAAAVPIATAAGAVITDAYGNSFADMALTDIGPDNQRSCIAAANQELHSQLMSQIRW